MKPDFTQQHLHTFFKGLLPYTREISQYDNNILYEFSCMPGVLLEGCQPTIWRKSIVWVISGDTALQSITKASNGVRSYPSFKEALRVIERARRWELEQLNGIPALQSTLL
jgi:hypothetical protein